MPQIKAKSSRSGPDIPMVRGLFTWSEWLIGLFIINAALALAWQWFDEGKIVSDFRATWHYVLFGGSIVAAVAALGTRHLARRIERQLKQMGSIDALTGLPNRMPLMERVERENVAVLYIDLDRFKVINDSLGHDTGDEVLKIVAQRIRHIFRESDLVCRLGGDEFVVVVEDEKAESVAVAAATRVINALHSPLTAQRRELFVTASIGIAVKCEELREPNDLLRAADLALYRAKRQGRDQVVIFNQEMESNNVLAQLDLESDLWRAVERNEMEVYYQPEINIESGKIIGFEALVRWNHPKRGLLKPESFIGLAEENGALRDIGLWVIEQSCRQWRRWQEEFAGNGPLSLSVNLSLRQLEAPDLVDRIQEIIWTTGMDASQLRLEITESVLLSNRTDMIAQLHRLRKMGIRLAIDDFGTGYSSLNYLKQLPVHGVKIDQSFVRNLGDDDATMLIVQAIVTLAHDLGLDVTAEGVETKDQLDRLFRLGCDRGQGYYLSEPQPTDAIERLLRAYTRRQTEPVTAA